MSTILKALRRLEEQRTAASEQRPLREEVAAWDPPAPAASLLRGWLPAAAALAVGLVGGGVAFWLVHGSAPWESSGKASVATVAPPAAPSPPVAAAPRRVPPAKAPELARVAGSSPTTPFTSDVEVVPRPRPAPRVTDSEPLQLPEVRPKGPGALRPVDTSPGAAKARREALEALRRARAAAAEAVVTPEPDVRAASPPAPAPPVQRVAQASAEAGAPPAPERTAAPPAPAPVKSATAAPPAPAPVKSATAAPPPQVARSTPPQEAPAAEVPAIAVQRTEWHPLPERRSAWVVVGSEGESRHVVEGDVVEGLLVSAIEPSGVVFDRDGQTLRRAVGAD